MRDCSEKSRSAHPTIADANLFVEKNLNGEDSMREIRLQQQSVSSRKIRERAFEYFN